MNMAQAKKIFFEAFDPLINLAIYLNPSKIKRCKHPQFSIELRKNPC